MEHPGAPALRSGPRGAETVPPTRGSRVSEQAGRRLPPRTASTTSWIASALSPGGVLGD